MKRYQECNVLVKLFRRRYYLYMPFQYLYTRIKHRKLSRFDKSILWDSLLGEAQCNMKWTYTSDEVKENLNKVVSDHKSKERNKKLKKLGL